MFAELEESLPIEFFSDYIDSIYNTLLAREATPSFISVCNRTSQVQRVIMRNLEVSTCQEITQNDLMGLSGLALNNMRIYSLKRVDLTNLDLRVNRISILPEEIFNNLTKLTQLSLRVNSIYTLPNGIFDNLTKLTTLLLTTNSISTLPDGIFNNLTKLTTLLLTTNSISILPEGILPEGIFNELVTLVSLYLDSNGLNCTEPNYINWGLPAILSFTCS